MAVQRSRASIFETHEILNVFECVGIFIISFICTYICSQSIHSISSQDVSRAEAENLAQMAFENQARRKNPRLQFKFDFNSVIVDIRYKGRPFTLLAVQL